MNHPEVGMWTRLEIAMLVAFVVGIQAHSRVSAAQALEAESGHALLCRLLCKLSWE